MISATNIYVQYGDRVLMDNINVVIGVKDRVGLVGRNGAGKSTLLKIIADEVSPDKGTVSRPTTSTLGFLHQEMTIPKGKTVMDEALTAFDEVLKLEREIVNLTKELEERTDYETDSYTGLISKLTEANERFLILGGNSMKVDAEKVLKGLGFKHSDLNRLTDEFSGGWQMRIELTKMLLRRPDFLLLDEPTNHLDIESIIWLEKFLKTYEGAVVVISHDKQFLDNITKRTIEIELGKIFEYKASYSKFVTMRKERREMQEASFKNQQRDIAHKERIINKFMAKATKTKMAQSMKKQLDKIERIEIDSEDTAAMKIKFPPAPRSGDIAVEAKKLTKQYGDLVVLENVDIKLDRGDRVAFVGQNGQGKTTLAKILVNQLPATKGDLKPGHNIQIGYYAQNQAEFLNGNTTVLQTMEAAAPPEMRTRLRNILGAFMFSGEDVEKKVMVLSGGERARLALACLLLRPFNLLVLDEPTNHLDMISKDVLKKALQDYDGTMIVVSHDRDFLGGLTNRTIEFRDKKLHNHIGDVNAFLEKRAVDNMREIEKMTVHKKQQKEDAGGSKALSHEERKALKKLERAVQNAERKIEDIEKKIAKIEEEMGAEGFYESDAVDATMKKYNDKKAELDQAMQDWEAAQEKLDSFQ